ELAEHAAPLLPIEIGTDAEHAERIVAERACAVVVLAAQHGGQMRDAESLAGTVHARQRLLRDDGRIPGLRRIEAVVAVSARRIERIAEVREQQLAAAFGGFRIAEQ